MFSVYKNFIPRTPTNHNYCLKSSRHYILNFINLLATKTDAKLIFEEACFLEKHICFNLFMSLWFSRGTEWIIHGQTLSEPNSYITKRWTVVLLLLRVYNNRSSKQLIKTINTCYAKRGLNLNNVVFSSSYSKI